MRSTSWASTCGGRGARERWRKSATCAFRVCGLARARGERRGGPDARRETEARRGTLETTGERARTSARGGGRRNRSRRARFEPDRARHDAEPRAAAMPATRDDVAGSAPATRFEPREAIASGGIAREASRTRVPPRPDACASDRRRPRARRRARSPREKPDPASGRQMGKSGIGRVGVAPARARATTRPRSRAPREGEGARTIFAVSNLAKFVLRRQKEGKRTGTEALFKARRVWAWLGSGPVAGVDSESGRVVVAEPRVHGHYFKTR